MSDIKTLQSKLDASADNKCFNEVRNAFNPLIQLSRSRGFEYEHCPLKIKSESSDQYVNGTIRLDMLIPQIREHLTKAAQKHYRDEASTAFLSKLEELQNQLESLQQ